MVDFILKGVIFGAAVVCVLTLIKSIIELLDIDSKYLDSFLRSCNSCFTFWVVLILTLNLFSASIAWILALCVEKLKQ